MYFLHDYAEDWKFPLLSPLYAHSPASKRLTGHSSSFLYKCTDPLCYMIHYCTITRCYALSSLLPIACYGISYALLLQLPKRTLTHFACKYSNICLDMLVCIYVYILSSLSFIIISVILIIIITTIPPLPI